MRYAFTAYVLAMASFAFAPSAAHAQDLAPADYVALPSGTKLVYDDFSCTVEREEQLEMVCSVDSGGRLTTVGKIAIVGAVPRVSFLRILQPNDIDVKSLTLEGDSRAAIGHLWPLEVGKSVEFSMESQMSHQHTGYSGVVRKVNPRVQATARVVGTEVLKIAGAEHSAYVVEVQTDSFSVPGYTAAAFKLTWWYAPDLGVMVKARTEWTLGPTFGQSTETQLVQAVFPAGAAPAIAQTTSPAPPAPTTPVTPEPAAVPVAPQPSSAAASTVPAEPALDKAESQRIQQDLRVLGFYSGAIDGDLGAGSRRAIADFQRANGLEPTGHLSRAQILALSAQAGMRAAELAAQEQAPAATPPAPEPAPTPAEQAEVPVASKSALDTTPALEPIDTIFVAVAAANVRTRPDLLAPRVTTLQPGEHIAVLGKVVDQNWYLVMREDEPLGYVVSQQLVTEADFAESGATRQASDDTAAPVAPPEAAPPVEQTAAVPAEPAIDFGRYHALIIGNNEYASLPRLNTAVRDAAAVAAVLRDDYGFEVTVLTNVGRDEIVSALDELRSTLGWDDNLLIYYAGHGYLDDAAGRGYWLPVDASPDNRTRWLSNADVTDALKAMQAKHVMIVADSCYSGTLTRSAAIPDTDVDYLRRISGKRARLVLTSGGNEPVEDGTDHSPFAKAFVDVLRNNDGAMVGTELFSALRRPVMLSSPQTPEYSDMRFADHDGGDFVFVRE